MMLSAEEIEDLKTRAKYAHAYGFQIALAEEYASQLGYSGDAVPAGMTKFSPAHLLSLIEGGGSAPAAPEKLKKAKKVKATKAVEEPEADKPEADKPEADKPEADKPEADKPEADKPEAESSDN